MIIMIQLFYQNKNQSAVHWKQAGGTDCCKFMDTFEVNIKFYSCVKEMSLAEICENAKMAREYALLGNYDTSLVYYQGVIQQIQKHIQQLKDDAIMKQEWHQVGCLFIVLEKSPTLQSNQVKRTPQESINKFIIQKLNPLLVVDFRLISAFLYFCLLYTSDAADE